MARAGFRIGVVGATGTLGTELLERLDLSSLRVSEIVPIATDDSLGREIEFQGSVFPVETDDKRVPGLDLVFPAPGFNEFAVSVPGSAAAALSRARDEGLVGGLDLAPYAPELGPAVLVCTTELSRREAIDRLVGCLAGRRSR